MTIKKYLSRSIFIITILLLTQKISFPGTSYEQTPFHGSPAPIPGKIEAEDFDKGGEGVAYHDTDQSNNGRQYRLTEGVDIESCGEGGFSVGWIQNGEWLEYTVDVHTNCRYTFEIRVASLSNGGYFHIEFDNIDVTGRQHFPKTDGWQTWTTVSIADVVLSAGEQVMKFVAENNDFNVNYINLIRQAIVHPPTVTLTAPEDKAEFTRGDDITLAATASDSDGYIVKVEFYADAEKIGEAAGEPYSMLWENLQAEKYDLTAVAIDNDGARTTSKKVDISVNYPHFDNVLLFSAERGFYSSSFDLQISTDLEGASIKFTLDGSNPLTSSSALAKSSPVTIRIDPDNSTNRGGKTPGVVVRAAAVKNEAQQTKLETHTYLFIGQVASQTHPGGDWPNSGVNGQRLYYDMNQEVVTNSRYHDLIDAALLDIPSISMVTDLDNLFDPAIGIYVNAKYHGMDWERPASIELLSPDGSGGFQINSGIRIRGGYSRHNNFRKHAFRLFFREKYGESRLEYPLFENEGVTEFKKIDLRTSQNYAWSNGNVRENTMNRDVFSRDVQREMGQPYTRSRYYHLYINGLYWGLFQTQERSEANFAESYLGGNDNDYDVIKVDVGENINLYVIEATDGNLDGWRAVWEACQVGFSSNTNYFKLEGRGTDGSKYPHGKKLVDISNLIDYMLIIFYAGNFDAPVSKFSGNYNPNNFYAIYKRDSNDGFKFFAHDCEHTLLMHNAGPGVGINENRVTFAMNVSRFDKFHPQWLHHRLTANAEYRVRFGDHIYKHFFNNGIFTQNRVTELFLKRANELDLAIIAESARWGDMQRSKHNAWQPAINEIVNAYFPQRYLIVMQQLIDAGLYSEIKPPIFRTGGEEITDESLEITTNFELELVNANATNGTIKYTLDGNDPREIGGSVSSQALDGGDRKTIIINATVRLKARVYYADQWSALHEISFTANESLNSLKLTEIHYHPLDEGAVSGKEYEFIELKNTGTTSLNLSLVSFIKGIDYSFPSGAALKAGEFIVVVSNMQEFKNRYGFDAFAEFEGQLNNGGEKLVLTDVNRDTIIFVNYNDKSPWPEKPDQAGYSLVCKGCNAPGDPNDPANWRASYRVHGSPGADDLASPVVETHRETPNKFTLEQNYPNPFNPGTTIRFAVKASCQVKLTIFDLLGRSAATLIDKKLTPGYFTVQWNGQNHAAGIYFYQLQTSDGFVAIKKMVLLK